MPPFRPNPAAPQAVPYGQPLPGSPPQVHGPPQHRGPPQGGPPFHGQHPGEAPFHGAPQGHPGHAQALHHGAPGHAAPPAVYDPAMMPRQTNVPNLEGWDPGTIGGRGGLAWAAIALTGWMALMRLAEAVLALVLLSIPVLVLSALAVAFYVWATIGLYKQNPRAYPAVMRAHGLLATLGLVYSLFSFAQQGLALGTIVQLVAIGFHLVAMLVTYLARHDLGYEWSS